MDIHNKYENLKQYLRGLGSVVAAFSSGVDSTLLLKAAHNVLGGNVIAVTARSRLFPERELKEAAAFCKEENIRHIIFDFNEFEIDKFSQNPPDRCYLCKKAIFTKILSIAREYGTDYVVEGSNIDDTKDYRPGMLAIGELGIKSPLLHACLTKDEIRALSNELKLTTWNKQSFACLASRFPYSENITPEKLNMVEYAEQLLLDVGLRQTRVRHHGDIARIETDEDGYEILNNREIRERIYIEFKRFGFTYVSIDLLGYRTGSMNESLKIRMNDMK